MLAGKGYRRTYLMILGSRRHISLPSMVCIASLLALFWSVTGPCPVSADAVQQEQELLTVGVLELEAGGVVETEARAISDRLRLFLGRTGVFEVIERAQMEEIMVEQGFQMSGACNTNECIIQAGEILGARKMVAGQAQSE